MKLFVVKYWVLAAWNNQACMNAMECMNAIIMVFAQVKIIKRNLQTSNNQVIHNNIASLTIISPTVSDTHSKVGVCNFLYEDW